MVTPPPALVELGRWFDAEGYRPVAAPGRLVWRGHCAGREVEVSIVRRAHTIYHGEMRARRLLGFSLGVGCSTAVRSRLVWWAPLRLVRAWPVRWLNRQRKLQVLEFPAALPAGRGLLASEPAWAAQVVGSPALEAVAALLEQTDARDDMGSLVLFPGRWDSTAPLRPPAEITPQWVAQRIHTLVDLATQVEALPAPREPAEPTWLERWSAAHPLAFTLGLLASVIVTIGATVLGLLALVAWLLSARG